MNFSIVIPTSNRGKKIKDTIPKLLNMNHGKNNYEVVIVDNNSTDNTKDIIHSFQKKFSQITYVFEPISGPSFARNAGINHAKNQHIIFLDDDIKFNSNLLTEYETLWQEYPDATLIGGKIVPILNEDVKDEEIINVFSDYRWFYGYLDLGKEDKQLTLYDALYPKWKQFLYSGNMSLKQDKHSPWLFNTNFGRPLFKGRRIAAEDFELCIRVLAKNKKVVYSSKVAVETVVDPKRVNKKFIEMRHFFGGIELFLLGQELNSSIYHDPLAKYSNIKPFVIDLKYIKENMRTKYELFTYLGYFIAKRFFNTDSTNY